MYPAALQSKHPSVKVVPAGRHHSICSYPNEKGTRDVENRLQKLAATLVFALLACASVPLECAAEGSVSPADVLVLVRPLQGGGEAFRQVVTEAARNAIESRGLVMSLPSSLPPSGAADGAVNLARQSFTAAALDCAYTVERRELVISIDWYDAATGASVAHGAGKGAVDLQLDRVITEVLNTVLAAADDQVQRLRSAREKSAAALASSNGAGAALVPPQGAAVTPGTGVGSPLRSSAPTRMILSASFAPFIATGAASYYFTVGYLPSILASLVFTTPSGRIGLGLSAGVDFFSAVGPDDTSDNFLFPLGVDVRYELAVPRFAFFLHLAGGPAALLILTGSHQTFVNLVPFVRTGIGAEMFLSSLVGIGVNADYEIYFVTPYFLMGFAPAVSVTFRL